MDGEEAVRPKRSNGYRSIRSIRGLLGRITVYSATATAAIFLEGLIVSFVAICFVPHPNLGWSDNVALDAKAVATGHLQYGNPATQFVGQAYGPLFTFLFAGLLRIYWWEGWGPVLSMVAVAVALISLVRMLWTTSRRIEARLATASVVVALVSWRPFRIQSQRPLRSPN